MILKETAIAALITELHHTEMYAFHLMASGIDMPETVTKEGLTKIISVLCKKLAWIKEECIAPRTKDNKEIQDTKQPEKQAVQVYLRNTCFDISRVLQSPHVHGCFALRGRSFLLQL